MSVPLQMRDPPAPQPVPSARRWLHLPRSRFRRALFIAVYAAFCWGLVYGGGKLFWRVSSGVPLRDTAFVLDLYFPEIRRSRVHEVHPRHADDKFDFLLLGGSVLEPAWDDVEKFLKARLQAELGDRWRLFNLGCSAHTSRDSLIKYSEMKGEQFDLVIVYDGINDLRLNCCPRDAFRDDYSHIPRYRNMQKYLDAGTMKLPAGLLEPTRLTVRN